MAKHLPSLKRAKTLIGNTHVEEGEEKDHFPASLYISNDEIEKMGLSGAEVGDEKMLMAKVQVTSVSISWQGGSDKCEN